MNIDMSQFKGLSSFENVIIVDDKGVVTFYDVADLNTLKELGLRPNDILGKHVAAIYKNINNENSTLLNVLRSGKPILNFHQKMMSRKGNIVHSINSTYPITENNRVVGAIEFSKHFYRKEDIQCLDNYSSNKIYRKNNTIYTIDDIITINPKMNEIKKKITKVARTNSSVLIYGRTGTGKEVAAQAIHNMSERYNGPFISQNCGAIPSTLLESILFGTVKGSFTGAEDKMGLFEQANGGTLFLDEINSLDVNLQVKLLRALEEKAIRRVGGDKNIYLDIRVISATNEDPDKIVREKILREDLFYRLGVVQINIPDLTERREDIKVLLDHYIGFYNNNMSINIESVHPDVIDCFYKYDWPGNIRELRNAVETAYNNAETNQITLADIPERISRYSERQVIADYRSTPKPLKETVEDYEKSIITRELRNAEGRIAETARRLGISKQLLKYKMSKYLLETK